MHGIVQICLRQDNHTSSTFQHKMIVAASLKEQQLSHVMKNPVLLYANNKGADLRSLISAFVVRCLDSIIPLVPISEISSLCLASVVASIGLSLTWSQTQKTGFLVTRLNYPKFLDRQQGWIQYFCIDAFCLEAFDLIKLDSKGCSSNPTPFGSTTGQVWANRVDPDQTALIRVYEHGHLVLTTTRLLLHCSWRSSLITI